MSSAAASSGMQDIVDRFVDFYRNYYHEAIGELAQHYPQEQSSLYIEASDLYRWDQQVLRDWTNSPEQFQTYAEEALSLYDLPIDISPFEPTVRLRDSHGTLDQYSVTEIQPEQIGEYVAITGQLSRITGKSPRLDEATYICKRCGTDIHIPQSRTDVQEPHECPGCERQGPFSIDQANSEYINQRKIKLEEPIEERSQARGQSLPAYIEGDLCDYGPGETTLPDHAGEKATICGIVRVDESQHDGRSGSPETEYWIEANAIVFEADDEADVDIEQHREEFEALAARDDAMDLVAESLATSLHAEEGDDLYTARRAVAAWLFNAYRVDPEGAGSKRGDLHMALIGDPGTGKSTLMSSVHDVLPNSEYRSGTGLSKVGLTAAAVQEEFAGQTEWTLQPGILPRADGGHTIIDEVDAIVDEDTKAIHDALEGDQMVKADKAGITADLPTRTAVLVGGNPTYTRFDPYEPIVDQIDLDPALFDRMDLVYTLEDEVDEARDANKAEHTLDAWDDLTAREAAQRQGQTTADAEETAIDPPVEPDVLRAWVAYARRNVFPTPTPEVKDRLREFYVEVRDLNDGHGGDDVDAAVPATPRTLEAGIRTSIAVARVHLSETIELEHAERAIELTEEVVGLSFDPDSGEYDAEIVGSGTPKSQRDRIKSVYAIIEDIEVEYDDGAPIETVLDRAEEEGVDRDKAEHEIEKLKQQGELYEPRNRHVRTS